MKRSIILLIALSFFLVGFGYAQDCSKCPSKSKCGKAKVETKADAKVYISITKAKEKKVYHKKNGCNIKNAVPITLKKAEEKKYKPCPVCFPKTKKVAKKDENK
jgi:hypothetical protein